MAFDGCSPQFLHVVPGQVVTSVEPLTLRTVLGSCVSVCVWDTKTQAGGMNHFLLPAALDNRPSTRHGETAMAVLFEQMDALGSSRSHFVVRVFGGARILIGGSELARLGQRNVDFALDWLARQGLVVATLDVGGSAARRLDFDLRDGTANVRHVGGQPAGTRE